MTCLSEASIAEDIQEQRELEKTRLYNWHITQRANMANFGNYLMPLWYPSGVRNEHLAVLTNAGIFDTSHMAAVIVEGADAFDLLQLCFSKDLRTCVGKNRHALSPGKCVYGVFLKEGGDVIDDAIVYQLHRHLYMVVVNSGMGSELTLHLAAQAGDGNVKLTNLSDRLGKMDIQGPRSARVLEKILEDPETALSDLGYFTFRGHFEEGSLAAGSVRLQDGTPILLSRTGYTGEFGFEIFIQPDRFVALWEMILDAGTDYEVKPCGLAARDSLRTGAGLPLSHQDIGSWPFIKNPWHFALPFNADQTVFTKHFIGDKALLKLNTPASTYGFVGYDLRKVSIHDPAVVLTADGVQIGVVLTCVTDMAIDRVENRIYSIGSLDKPDDFKPRGLCCGFVKVNTKLNYGDPVVLKDQRREIKVVITNGIRPDRSARFPIQEMMAPGKH